MDLELMKSLGIKMESLPNQVENGTKDNIDNLIKSGNITVNKEESPFLVPPIVSNNPFAHLSSDQTIRDEANKNDPSVLVKPIIREEESKIGVRTTTLDHYSSIIPQLIIKRVTGLNGTGEIQVLNTKSIQAIRQAYYDNYCDDLPLASAGVREIAPPLGRKVGESEYYMGVVTSPSGRVVYITPEDWTYLNRILDSLQ